MEIHDVSINTCMNSNVVCNTPTNLEKHLETEHVEERDMRNDFEDHQKDNSVQNSDYDNGVKMKCKDCAYESKCIEEYVKHLINTHKEDSVSYKCSFCEYTTKDTRSLDIHIVHFHNIVSVLNGLSDNQTKILKALDKLSEENTNRSKNCL